MSEHILSMVQGLFLTQGKEKPKGSSPIPSQPPFHPLPFFGTHEKNNIPSTPDK